MPASGLAVAALDWIVANVVAAFLATIATLVLAGVTFYQTRASLRRDRLRDYHDLAVNVYGPLRRYLRGWQDPSLLFGSSTPPTFPDEGDSKPASWPQVRAQHPGLSQTLPKDLRACLDRFEAARSEFTPRMSEAFHIANRTFAAQAHAAAQPIIFNVNVQPPTIRMAGWPAQLNFQPGPLELWAQDWTVEQWVDRHRKRNGKDGIWDARLIDGQGKDIGDRNVVERVVAATRTALKQDTTMTEIRAQAATVAELARQALGMVERELSRPPV